jgi:hypothetical protein
MPGASRKAKARAVAFEAYSKRHPRNPLVRHAMRERYQSPHSMSLFLRQSSRSGSKIIRSKITSLRLPPDKAAETLEEDGPVPILHWRVTIHIYMFLENTSM